MLKFFLIIFFLYNFSINAFENKIMVASTTSTYDTGLLKYLNNIFKSKFNIEVQVLAQGTGQAIRTAKEGNVEVLLVHHKKSEYKFMNDGYGLERYNLMYNDYVLVGSKFDENECINIEKKLHEIFSNNFKFISRGDDSGTHKKELELWASINKNPQYFNSWYLKVGQGMGMTLLIANEKSAYTLSDRSTWIAFNKRKNLKIICENFPPLINQYGLILVNPSINSKLNIQSAKIYVDWLISDEGEKLINAFKKKDQQLFFYNHH